MNQLFSSLSRFSRSEQTILVAGSLVIFLYLLWMVILAPLQHKRDHLLEVNAATEQSLGRVQLLARQVQNLSQQSNQSAAGGSDNISGLIDASLHDNGLSMTNFTPGTNGEVRISIAKAGSEPLMQWLYELETKHHLAIRELSITASNDPGQVAVNIRLLKP